MPPSGQGIYTHSSIASSMFAALSSSSHSILSFCDEIGVTVFLIAPSSFMDLARGRMSTGLLLLIVL
jgi:hypothetical protein